jgi:hypothetical protein
MNKMPLSLNPDSNAEDDLGAAHGAGPAPVMGWFAVGFGLLGIFTIGFIFVPLCLICSVIALFSRQAVWGVVGVMLAVAGLLTSPKLWLIIGMSAAYALFDFNDLFQPILDFFGMGEGTEV